MITPTVGRVVWYHPASNDFTPGFIHPVDGQPLAAIVARVVDDGCVNLTVFDAAGVPWSRQYVPLIQEGEDVPADGYAEWMPYQKGQAKKAEAENAAAQGQLVGAVVEPDNRYLRAQILDMALRTPGLRGHADVLKAAGAYMAHIEGEST